MQITLVFSALKRNLVFTWGAELAKDDEMEQVEIVESVADTQIALGFQPNRTEDDEE